MLIEVHRINHDQESTSGWLAIDGVFECFCLEDQTRKPGEKVPGETAIPAGTYSLDIRQVDTPLTKKYRAKYDWFKYHIEIRNIPGFNYVYIHIGNTDDHTDGCLLLGDVLENKGTVEDFLGKSTQAFKRFYEKVYPVVAAGHEPVRLRIY